MLLYTIYLFIRVCEYYTINRNNRYNNLHKDKIPHTVSDKEVGYMLQPNPITAAL